MISEKTHSRVKNQGQATIMILYNVFENNSIQSFREFPDAQNRFQKERTSVFTFPDLANGFDSVFDTETPLRNFGLPLLF